MESPTLNPDSPVVSTPGDMPEDGSQATPAWAPQPGDESLLRQDVQIEKMEVLTLESFPPQFRLHLAGVLPNPCAQLRIIQGEADGDGNLPVEVYALVDPAALCAQVTKDFEVSFPLEGLSAGRYQVVVNGQTVAEIEVPEVGAQLPGVEEGEGMKGSLFLDSVDLLKDAGSPSQYSLHLSGNLPTPCHKLVVDVQPPDAQNRIRVRAYTTSDPGMICAQVLKPFTQVVPIEAPDEQVYSVWLNGEEVGSIEP